MCHSAGTDKTKLDSVETLAPACSLTNAEQVGLGRNSFQVIISLSIITCPNLSQPLEATKLIFLWKRDNFEFPPGSPAKDQIAL